MSGRTRKLPIRKGADLIQFTFDGDSYQIPRSVAAKYKVSKNDGINLQDAFQDLIAQHSQPGLLLKGLRAKEGLTQIQLAKKLKITQANLSSVENGRRAIGKDMATRLEKLFKIDYRIFM